MNQHLIRDKANTQLELENSILQPENLLRTQMTDSQEVTRRTDHQVDNRTTDKQANIRGKITGPTLEAWATQTICLFRTEETLL